MYFSLEKQAFEQEVQISPVGLISSRAVSSKARVHQLETTKTTTCFSFSFLFSFFPLAFPGGSAFQL